MRLLVQGLQHTIRKKVAAHALAVSFGPGWSSRVSDCMRLLQARSTRKHGSPLSRKIFLRRASHGFSSPWSQMGVSVERRAVHVQACMMKHVFIKTCASMIS